MADLASWESSVLGQKLDSDGVKADAGQCSQVSISWAEALFPGTPWSQLLPESPAGVDEWAGKSTKFLTWIPNNPKDINQLPLPGDIIVFGATPAKGYASQFVNPDGHTGVVKAASVSGVTIVQQNAPQLGEGVNDGSYPWTDMPCLGWFRAVNAVVETPAPAPIVPAPAAVPVQSPIVGQFLNFPAAVKSWWTYNPGGPYDAAHHAHVLTPSVYGGFSRQITQDLGNGVYQINTDSHGPQAVIAGAPLTVTAAPTLATD